MGKVSSCNTVWTFHPRAQCPEASSIIVTKWSKGKRRKFLNYLLLTSELPMGQTVISVSPCSALCSLKVSYFESSLSAGIEALHLWFKKKKIVSIGILSWILWSSFFSKVPWCTLMYKAMHLYIRPKGFENFYFTITQLKVSDCSCTSGIYSIIRKESMIL